MSSLFSLRRNAVLAVLCALFAVSLAACSSGNAGDSASAGEGAGSLASESSDASAEGGDASEQADTTVALSQEEAEALLRMGLDATSFNNVSFAFLDATEEVGAEGESSVSNTTVEGKINNNGKEPQRLWVCSYASTKDDPVTWSEYVSGESHVVVLGDTAVAGQPSDVGIAAEPQVEKFCLSIDVLRELAERAQKISGEQSGGQTVIEMVVGLDDLSALGLLDVSADLGDVDLGASHAYVDVMTDISNHVVGVRFATYVYADRGSQTREVTASYYDFGSTVVDEAPSAITVEEYKSKAASSSSSASGDAQKNEESASGESASGESASGNGASVGSERMF